MSHDVEVRPYLDSTLNDDDWYLQRPKILEIMRDILTLLEARKAQCKDRHERALEQASFIVAISVIKRDVERWAHERQDEHAKIWNEVLASLGR